MRDARQLLRWRQRYDPDGFLLHRSRASLRLPQCFSLREESNTRSPCRFRALITLIRANMVGSPRSATSISHRRDRILIPVKVRPDVATFLATGFAYEPCCSHRGILGGR